MYMRIDSHHDTRLLYPVATVTGALTGIRSRLLQQKDLAAICVAEIL